jgi:hypothetical protein
MLVDLTNEAWDDFMGILIFIGAAFVNALFIWGVVWFYQRAKAVVGHAPLTKESLPFFDAVFLPAAYSSGYLIYFRVAFSNFQFIIAAHLFCHYHFLPYSRSFKRDAYSQIHG